MKRRVVVVAAAALVLASCGSDDGASTDSVPDVNTATTAAVAAGVTIENAWARTSAGGQTTGAIYFDLTSSDDDRLLGASVPTEVAADAQVHEVVAADMTGDTMTDDTMDDMGDDMDMDMDMGDDDMDMGAMVMQELKDGLELKAGTTVSFAPGGYHVMLLDLVDPLEVGDEIELTLDFETAGSQTITVVVAESAP